MKDNNNIMKTNKEKDTSIVQKDHNNVETNVANNNNAEHVNIAQKTKKRFIKSSIMILIGPLTSHINLVFRVALFFKKRARLRN